MAKKVRLFTGVDLSGETTVHFHENELLLLFDDDEGAVAFIEWWNRSGGLEAFSKWLANSEFADLLENRRNA